MTSLPNNSIFADKTFSWKDGRRWFDAGVNFFKQVKHVWYVLCLIVMVLMLLAGNISAGFMAEFMVFVSPFVTAFMMLLCQKVNTNQTNRLVSTWQGILNHINVLVMLGLIAVVLNFIFHHVHLQLLAFFNLVPELTTAMAQNMSGKESLLRLTLNLLTNLPLALALAFSPALVIFIGVNPLNSVKISIMGVVKAWKAFLSMTLLFMLLFFGILLIASLAMNIFMAILGPNAQSLLEVMMLFLVLTVAGIGLCAQYQAYTEIFTQPINNENNDTEIYTEI